MLDIVIGGTSVIRDSSEKGAELPPTRRSNVKERRKNILDRRKSVREGIFISLSTKNDRRVLRDRRKSDR